MTQFFHDDAWSGGFYEVAFEYPGNDRAPIIAGLHAVWGLPEIDGCYLDPAVEPNPVSRVDFSPALNWQSHLYGVASLPDNRRAACGTCCVLEDAGSNWLVLYLPLGSLGKVLPVKAFPFDSHDHETWRVPLDRWLAHLGQAVFSRAPFLLGLVGFETSGEFCAADVARSGIPSRLQHGLLLPTTGGPIFHARTL